MTEHEATLIADVLAKDNPGTAFQVVGVRDEKSRKVIRYSIAGPGGFRLDYAWQYLEMKLVAALTQRTRDRLLAPLNNGGSLHVR